MKQQVFAIHGGDAFPTYEEYLEFLKTRSIDLDRLKGSIDWKGNLQKDLGEGYDVYCPRMPNSNNAKYIEWKLWFERLVPFMQDGVILVGHSLGGIFLAKYLSENKMPIRVQATFIIAAPFDVDGDRKIVEFDLPQSLSLLQSQGGKIFLYQSKDDPVVSFGELAKYQAALPAADVRELDGRGHFNEESFPELLADIRSVQ